MVDQTKTGRKYLRDKAQGEFRKRHAWRELSRRRLRRFLERFAPSVPYYFGRHTEAMCARLQRAEEDYERGKASYVVLICPPRHGKSDLASRRFPLWHLGRHPNDEVILATYGANLAHKMSRKARQCFMSPEYGRTFGLEISSESASVGDWMVKDHDGAYHAIGIEGAITGHGAHVLVIDDYLKGREQAESEVIRDKVWDAFTDDLMSRLAPVHIVVIVATRWHEDDLVGRIKRHMEEDPEFPRFEEHVYPAIDVALGADAEEEVDGAWLFPERFSPEWYRRARGTSSAYSWQAMWLGEPRPRQGNLLRVDRVQYYDEPPEGLRWVRGWDLASSEKERMNSNPDFSCGVKLAVRGNNGLRSVYIDDVVKGQWSAPKRDSVIYRTARGDGDETVLGVEQVGPYKDAVTYMRRALRGKFIVRTFTPNVDKVIRAQALEAVFETGEVYLRRAAWNQEFLAELAAFPMGTKDDQVDGTTTAYHVATRSRPTVEVV